MKTLRALAYLAALLAAGAISWAVVVAVGVLLALAIAGLTR